MIWTARRSSRLRWGLALLGGGPPHAKSTRAARRAENAVRVCRFISAESNESPGFPPVRPGSAARVWRSGGALLRREASIMLRAVSTRLSLMSSVVAIGCAGQAMPDPRVAAAEYATAVEKGDS